MPSIRRDQRGIASIIVTMVIVIIIGLIVVVFASIVRREQRQTLDQQLSTQAFYAAESAINEKVAEIKAGNVSPVTECNQPAATPPVPRPAFGGDSNAEITCVLVNPTPDSLGYDIDTNESQIITITSGSALQKLIIAWQGQGGDTACMTSDYTNLPQSPGPGVIGMLRFDLFSAASLSRDSLINSNFGGVLYPKHNGLAPEATYANPADQLTATPAIFGTCGTNAFPPLDTPHGAAGINVAIPAGQTYMLRLRSLYSPQRVQVYGIDATGNTVTFSNSQLVIDATAKVGDVVRRLQARVNIGAGGNGVVKGGFPDFAVRTTGDLCKLLETNPAPGTTVPVCP